MPCELKTFALPQPPQGDGSEPLDAQSEHERAYFDPLRWNEELRAKKIPRYILSNTNDLSIRFIRKRFPFFNQFDGYVFSHEHRVMKPAPRIYELIEETAGLRGADLFYIDDRAENIHAAAERGWQVAHHVDPAQTLELARSIGL